MGEPFFRALVVLGVALLAGVVVWVTRKHWSQPGIRLEQTLLGPGIYLFTSATCADCGLARYQLTAVLGAVGFREIDWETNPQVFEELQIGAVPATLVVDDVNRSILFPGDTAPVLEALSP